MKIKVGSNLKKLSNIINTLHPLYIVGGYVRNSLIGLKAKDIDLCGPATLTELKKLLSGSMFEIIVKNEKLGTAQIKSGKEVYEYSTFRQEIYDDGGKHTPAEISFTRNIIEDASRRDYTINCIYYDISSGTLADFYFGQQDLKRKLIRAIETPEFVLKDDGVRILRLIRLACELNFFIDSNTMVCANNHAENLKAVSADRKRDEFLKILNAKYKYQVKNKNFNIFREIKLLDEFNIWKYFVDCKLIHADEIQGVGAHLHTYSKADLKHKLIALVYDIYIYLNKYNKVDNLSNVCKGFLGSGGLNFDKQLVTDYLVALNALEGILKINSALTDQITIHVAKTLKHTNLYFSLLQTLDKKIFKQATSALNKVKNKAVPKTEADLNISGDDILALGIENKKISLILNQLLDRAILTPSINTKEQLLRTAQIIIGDVK